MEDNDWGQIFVFQAHHVTMIFDGTLKCRNDLNELTSILTTLSETDK